MSDDLATQVRWLHDRELIRDLPKIYAYGVDTRDFDLVASVFHPECVVTGTQRTEAIDRYLKLLEPGVRQYHATLHFMGNQYVRVDGDGGHVETYAVAYHMEAEDSPIEDLLVGVRYQDDVVRVGDEWKINRRNVIRQWHRGPLPRPSQSELEAKVDDATP